MPYIGWYDVATGTTRPFGSEANWPDMPLGAPMAAAIARAAVNDRRHDRFVITPTTLLMSPRQVVMERFTDVALDPEAAAPMHFGAIIHEALGREASAMGYRVKQPVAGRLFGLDVVGEPDAFRDLITINGGPLLDAPDLLEFKFTTSGSLRFILEDGRAKTDHVVQVGMYRLLIAQAAGVSPQRIRAEIQYFAMPQKERTSTGWVRMPPGARFDAPFMPEEEIGDFRPAWSEPRKATDPTDPVPTVRENAASVAAAFEAIKAGRPVADVVRSLECVCNRRFAGQGRTYCGVSRECAMADHGTPIW